MNDLENILNIKFPDNCNISNITNNSKKVKKDSVFFGLCGKNNHGSKYSLEALKLGASFVVHDDEKFQIKYAWNAARSEHRNAGPQHTCPTVRKPV